MKHKQSMKNKVKMNWKKVAKEKHGSFARSDVVKDVLTEEVPGNATIIGNA